MPIDYRVIYVNASSNSLPMSAFGVATHFPTAELMFRFWGQMGYLTPHFSHPDLLPNQFILELKRVVDEGRVADLHGWGVILMVGG